MEKLHPDFTQDALAEPLQLTITLRAFDARKKTNSWRSRVLMYFEETEIRSFFCNLAQTFPGAAIYCDILSSWSSKKTKRHDTLSKLKATFKWGIDDEKEIL